MSLHSGPVTPPESRGTLGQPNLQAHPWEPSLVTWLCSLGAPRVCAGAGSWDGAQDSVWLQMLSQPKDFVQGSKCGESRTKMGGETGIQMMAC